MMKDLFPEVPLIQGDTIALKALTQNDAVALQEFVDSPRVYRYLPTFLFEKKYDDVHLVIDRLYTKCLEESLILGVFERRASEVLPSFTVTDRNSGRLVWAAALPKDAGAKG